MADASIRPSAEQVSELAQKMWAEAGRPDGQFENYRTRAEIQLRQEAQSNNPQTDAPAATSDTSASSGEEFS